MRVHEGAHGRAEGAVEKPEPPDGARIRDGSGVQLGRAVELDVVQQGAALHLGGRVVRRPDLLPELVPEKVPDGEPLRGQVGDGGLEKLGDGLGRARRTLASHELFGGERETEEAELRVRCSTRPARDNVALHDVLVHPELFDLRGRGHGGRQDDVLGARERKRRFALGADLKVGALGINVAERNHLELLRRRRRQHVEAELHITPRHCTSGFPAKLIRVARDDRAVKCVHACRSAAIRARR